MAMLAAVMCLLVVVTLSTVAMEQALGSISSSAQSRKLQQTNDAAEAGLQVELNAIGQVAASPGLSISCTPAVSKVTLSSISGISASYSTSLTPELTQVSLPVTPAPCTTYTQSTVTADPYVVITATGTTTDTAGGGPSFGHVMQEVVSVKNAGTTTTDDEYATAEAANINVVNGALAVTTAEADATPANAGAAQSPASVTALGGQSVVTTGVLAETAETLSSGTSFACSGAVSSPGVVQIGTPSSPCSVSGTGTNGVTINLTPIIGGIAGVADVYLTADSVVTGASEAVGAIPSTTCAITDLKVTVELLSLVKVTSTALSIPSGDNGKLLPVVVSAITGNTVLQLAGLTTLLSSALDGALSLTSCYETPASPSAGSSVFLSGLHIGVLNVPGNSALAADISGVSVGPNTSTTAPYNATVQVKQVGQGS
jgi:hypothetical protein